MHHLKSSWKDSSTRSVPFYRATRLYPAEERKVEVAQLTNMQMTQDINADIETSDAVSATKKVVWKSSILLNSPGLETISRRIDSHWGSITPKSTDAFDPRLIESAVAILARNCRSESIL
ncbi:hypothetical protein ABEB36_009865, partial [Hypothenemus hampei]